MWKSCRINVSSWYLCTTLSITTRRIVTRIWFGNSLFYLFLLPFSWLYGLITALIRLSYRCGWRKVYRFKLPIIVIGNLSVGGNGKTPLVVWLVSQLQQRGWRVGVVSRGYGGQAEHYPLILDNTTDSKQCGDEPLLIYKRTSALVAVAPVRAKAVAALLHIQPLDIIVTDDGLQHYALWRDIEWVVIDGERRFGNGWLLPAGPMREQISRLKSVNNIIINGGNACPGEVQMQLNANIVSNICSGEQRILTELTSVIVVAGIAYPSRFFSTIRRSGVIPIREVSFPDHYIYNQEILDVLVSPHEQLLMTEKDAIKCRIFARPNWWYLPVNVKLSDSAEQILLSPIDQVIRYYQKNKNET